MICQLKLIACPDCKTELKLVEGRENDEGKIKEGTLQCSLCHMTYPIVNYIPRFVSSTRIIPTRLDFNGQNTQGPSTIATPGLVCPK